MATVGPEPIDDDDSAAKPAKARRRPVAILVPITRTYDPDRESMLAALRVVLGLPRVHVRKEWDA